MYSALRIFLRWLLHAWFPWEVSGADNVPAEGPVLLAANHGSLLDPLLLIAASPRPVRFLVNEDLYHSLALGWLIRAIGGILVWRSRAAEGRLKEALQGLANGDVIGLFPEGTIVEQGRMETMRPGVAILLLRSGAPLVPVGIGGTVAALSFHDSVPRAEAPLAIGFGPTLHLPVASDSIDATLSAVRSAIQQVIPPLPTPRPRRPRSWVLAAIIVLPVGYLMSVASRQRERQHQARRSTAAMSRR